MTDNQLLIPNKIVKSKRKSISLIVKTNGEFIVRAPLNCKETDILSFIQLKAHWIISKRSENLKNKINNLTFNDNDTISILGESYTFIYHNKTNAKMANNLVLLPKEKTKERFIAFLKRLAKQYITERTQFFSSLFNFKYSNISISSAKTCWGSCSYNNRLHFTYKLMLCPKEVVDYIVIHELCHTKEKNHSKKFWTLVENCCANYKTYEKWLKQNRRLIEII